MKELELLEAICRGVDPRDGTFLDTPRDPDLDRVRLSYLSKLRRMHKRFGATGDTHGAVQAKPQMHGKVWTDSDDSALACAWTSDPTVTVETLAGRFGRGEGAIIARLVHVGLCSDRDQAREANNTRISASGQG